MSQDRISPELNEQLRRDRASIADELPELTERHDRMMEAQAEDTFSGHLRGAVHRSGRLVRNRRRRRNLVANALRNSSREREHCVPTSWTVWHKPWMPPSRLNRAI